MEFIQIEVSQRDALGTANANRIRRDGDVPAVLYGMKRPNLSLAIAETELERFLRTGSHLVELRLGKKTRPAILREMQVDATTDAILHVDFHRVDAKVEVETDIPLTWKGRAKGDAEGGVFQALKDTVKVRARPNDLPAEYIVDIGGMVLGDNLTIADLEVLKDVEFMEPEELIIAQVVIPKRIEIEEEPVVVEGEEGEAPADGEAPAAEGEAAEAAEGGGGGGESSE